MKEKPSLEEFRSGSREASFEGIKNTSGMLKTSHRDRRINKTIRIRGVFEEMLKKGAYLRSVEEGRRITESDIIDEALEEYFSKFS